MRLILATLLLATLASIAPAQDGSAASLLASARAAMKAGKPDAEIARTLSSIHLTERLENAVVEQLQTEGAGPETLDALDRQQELSREKPKPAAPLPLFDAPPPPSTEERTAVLEKARAAALKYTENLPNFLCTETVHRYTDPKKTELWTSRDWYTLAVGYSKKGEQYKLTTLSGKPTTKSLDSIGGFRSNGEFGFLLNMIFDPKYAGQFQWERWGIIRGRQAHVFAFFVDQAHSKFTVNLSGFLKHAHIVSGVRGAVYVDRETCQVLRITHAVENLPSNFPVIRIPGALDYDFTDIAGQKYLLPRRAWFRMVMKDSQSRNVMDFSDYRKFSGEATLIFDK